MSASLVGSEMCIRDTIAGWRAHRRLLLGGRATLTTWSSASWTTRPMPPAGSRSRPSARRHRQRWRLKA
eukprot:3332692-Alexandrium_andersonii.AAC.1